jgi:hypothetical protein
MILDIWGGKYSRFIKMWLKRRYEILMKFMNIHQCGKFHFGKWGKSYFFENWRRTIFWWRSMSHIYFERHFTCRLQLLLDYFHLIFFRGFSHFVFFIFHWSLCLFVYVSNMENNVVNVNRIQIASANIIEYNFPLHFRRRSILLCVYLFFVFRSLSRML